MNGGERKRGAGRPPGGDGFHNAPVEVELDCHHKQKFAPPPGLGDVVWCYTCANYRTVSLNITNQYRVRCQNCTLARLVGASIDEAHRLTRNHLLKNTNHKVVIFKGDLELWRGGHGERGQLPLPIQSWRDDHPEHQNGLKNLGRRVDGPVTRGSVGGVRSAGPKGDPESDFRTQGPS